MIETILLAVALAAPLALYTNSYDVTLVKALIAQLGAALAAGAWVYRSLSNGRFEIPEGRGVLTAAALAWLLWQPSPAPVFFLAALLGPASSGFSRKLQGAAALTAAALSVFRLMPDPHALGVFLAVAVPLALGWRRRPGEALAPAALSWASAALAAACVAATGSPVALIALIAGARGIPGLAAAAVALFLARYSEAQWLMLDLAPRPGALLALAVSVLCAWRRLWPQSGAAGALAAAQLFSPYDAGPLGWIVLGDAAGRLSSGVVVRVAPLPFSPRLRRFAWLPVLLALVWPAWRAAKLFSSDSLYNQAVAAAESDPARSLALLSGVWEGSPLYARAALTEAALHRRAGNMDGALAAYRRIPAEPRVSRAIGQLLLEQDDPESLLWLAKTRDERNRKDEKGARLYVEAAKRFGTKEDRLDAARALAAAAPRDPASWYALADAHRDLKQYDAAKAAQERGVQVFQVARRLTGKSRSSSR